MTTESVITAGQIDADSALDVTLASAWTYNWIAGFEGNSTNKVANAALASHPWGQADLNTTIGNISTTSTTGGSQTLPGGEYGFYPNIRISNSSGIAAWGYKYSSGLGVEAATNPSTTYLARAYLATNNASFTAAMQTRYFNASPPYDYGDGQVGRTIFAVVDTATGAVEFVYAALEAPWHYNGPTNIAAAYYRDNKIPCRKVSLMEYDKIVNNTDIVSMYSNPITRDEAISKYSDQACVELEITQDIKNKDMGLVPHPFQGNDMTGKVIVMLDPVSDLAWQLGEMQKCGEDINELLHRSYINLDNTPLTRTTPDGVIVVDASWKNSKRK